MSGEQKIVEAELVRIIIDETRLEQVVVLKEKSGKRSLPIIIGVGEAAAIKMEISGVQPMRPLTHDLLKNILTGLGAKLDKMVIDSLKNNTFYAKLYITLNGKAAVVDARPSDSIALAVRMKCPIYIAEDVLKQAGLETEAEK